jgi:hypothetical protein
MSEVTVAVNDESAQLAVKDAVLARSGIHIYSRDEVLAWGHKPKQDKPFYREYRPAGVMIEAKDKFNMVPVAKLHPATDITESNFHTFTSGVTGGPIEAVRLENGEVGLKGKIAFFTRDAFDFYGEGNRETSAGFQKVVREVSNSDELGYDFVLKEITKVNHIAIVPQGRGGVGVRVMDAAASIDKGIGGNTMGGKIRGGILERLGIVKAKDENFKFSTVLLESVAKVHSLDAAALEKEVATVMGHVNVFGDNESKEVLVGMVTDCYKHPVEVIAAKDKVAVKVDELYVACRDADSAVVKRILDSASVGDKKDGEDDKEDDKGESAKADAKDAAPKDLSAVIDEAVQKAVQNAVVAVTDSFEAKIEANVKKALGLEGEKGKPATGQVLTDATDSAAVEDASFLVRGCFGVN